MNDQISQQMAEAVDLPIAEGAEASPITEATPEVAFVQDEENLNN